MSLSLIQRPIQGSTLQNRPYPIWWREHLIYGVTESTDQSGAFKFKFILRVYLGSTGGTLIATVKQPFNGYENPAGQNYRAFFDVKDIVGSYLDFTVSDNNTSFPNQRSVHGLGTTNNDTTKIYGFSNNIMRRITVQFSYESASSADGVVTEQTGSKPTFSMHFLNGTYFIAPEESPTNMDLSASPLFDNYYPSTSTPSKLLSNVSTDAQVGAEYNFDSMSAGADAEDLRYNATKYIQFVGQNDKATVSFINVSSVSQQIRIKIFDASGQVSSAIAVSGNGGTTPPTVDQHRVLHFGCGPQNLSQQTINSTIANYIQNTDNWFYYTVTLENSSNVATSQTYYFVSSKYGSPCQNTNAYNNMETYSATRDGQTYVRLGYINAFGCWDYYNFVMKNVESYRITEKSVKSTPRGNFAGENYTENTFANTEMALGIAVKRVMTLNTGYISEGDAEVLQWLFKSPLVHYIGYGLQETSVPVKITSQSFTKKTIINDGLQIQHEFQIEFAHKEPVVAR